MSILSVKEMTPEIYTEESRDFQLLSRLYDSVFNGLKLDTDSILNLIDTKECRTSILQLLQTKLGFFTEKKIDDEKLRSVLECFPILVRNKGSLKSIKETLYLFLRMYSVSSDLEIYYLPTPSSPPFSEQEPCILASGKEPENNSLIIRIHSFRSKPDTSVLEEVFRYILPSGVNYYIEFDSKSKLSDVVLNSKDSAELMFISDNINSQVRGSDQTIPYGMGSVNTGEFISQDSYVSNRFIGYYDSEDDATDYLRTLVDKIYSTAVTGYTPPTSMSGPIVSFKEFDSRELESCICDVEPLQEGTGDPHPTIYNTVSGPIVTFESPVNSELRKLDTIIEPIQDLHGYDSPWPPRGGKNKLPMTLAGIKAANTTGTWSGNSYTLNGITAKVIVDSDDNVTGITVTGTASATFLLIVGDCTVSNIGNILNGCPSGGSASTYRQGIYVAGSAQALDTGTGVKIPSIAETAQIQIRVTSGYAISGTLTFHPMIRLSTESDATFAPFSNICPITGHTEVNVNRTGKNLLGNDTLYAENTLYSVSGSPSANSNFDSYRIKAVANQAVSLSGIPADTNFIYRVLLFNDAMKFVSSLADNISGTAGTRKTATVTPLSGGWIIVCARKSATDKQVELGSTATAYEAYNGNTYPISWPEIGEYDVEASQDLHGYDNPWPAGGNINKLDPARRQNLYGTNIQFYMESGESGLSLPAGTYRVQVYDGPTIGSFTVAKKSGETINVTYSQASNVFTLTEQTEITVLVYYQTGQGSSLADIRVALYQGSNYQSYAPYSNICPITPVTITRDDNTTLDIYNASVKGIFSEDGELTGGLLIEKMSSVNLGTLEWTISTAGANNRFYSNGIVSEVKIPATGLIAADIISSSYGPSVGFYIALNALTNNVIAITSDDISSKGNISVVDNAYNDAAAFKAAVNGVQLVYERATPVTINLSVAEYKRLLTAINASSSLYGANIDIVNGVIEKTMESEIYDVNNVPDDLATSIENEMTLETESGDVASFNCTLGEYPVNSLECSINALQEGTGTPHPDIYSEVTGDLVTFTAPAEKPVKLLDCSINPVQDLHGYSNPWPDGGNTNILPPQNVEGSMSDVIVSTTDDIYTIDGTASAYGHVIATGTITLEAGDYVIKGFVVSGTGNVNLQLRSTDGLTVYASAPIATYAKFTLSESVVAKFRITYSSNAEINQLKIKAMLVTGSTVPDVYYPYSNICPISGHTGLTMFRTGVNMWDEEWETGIYDTSTGNAVNNANRIRSKNAISVKPNTTYYAVCPAGGQLNVLYYDASGYLNSFNTVENATFTTPSRCCFVKFFVGSLTLTTYNNDVSINYPSTDHDYHAYVGNTYSVSWPEISEHYVESSQDLHGYANPWPAGGGKNLVGLNHSPDGAENLTYVTLSNRTDDSVTLTSSNNTYACLMLYYFLKAGTYTASTKAETSDSGFTPTITIYKNGVSTPLTGAITENTSRTFTLSEDTNINIRFFATTDSEAVRTVRYYDFQLEPGSTATSWTPYSNICPITPISLTRDDNTTLNIYDATVSGIFNSSGVLTGGLLTNKKASVDLGTLSWFYDSTYSRFASSSLSSLAKFPSSSSIAADIECSEYGTASADATSISSGNGKIGLSVGKNVILRNEAYNSSAIVSGHINFLEGVQLVYELETPTTINLSVSELRRLLTTINASSIVYYGTLDVTNGKLTITSQGTSVSGGFAAVANGTFYKETVFTSPAPSTASEFISSYFQTNTRDATGGTAEAILTPEKLRFQNISSNIRILIYTTAFASVSDFNTALSTKPLDIVISLATPLIYQLTPTQVNTLVGENVMWHDCNGETSVKYVSDIANIRPINGYGGLTTYRTGRNLYNPENAEQNKWINNSTGEVETSNGFWFSGYIPVISGKTYYKNISTGSSRAAFYDADKNPVSYYGLQNGVFTIPSGVSYFGFCGLTSDTPYNAKIQIELGSTASSYEDYRGNTYSVSWPEINEHEVKASQNLHGYDNPWPAGGGVNLIPDGTDTSKGYKANYRLLADGTEVSFGTYCISEYFPITAGESYLYTVINYDSETTSAVCFYDSSYGYITGIGASPNGNSIAAPANAAYARASFTPNNSGNDVRYVFSRGSIAPTQWTPYSNICPITPVTFTRDNNTTLTVYGGTIEGVFDSDGVLTGGLLTQTMANVDLGTLSWVYDTSQVNPFFSAAVSDKVLAPTSVNMLCSAFPVLGSLISGSATASAYIPDFTIAERDKYGHIYAKNSNYTDAAAFKTAMSGVQLVYELATSVTYNLSVAELKRFLTTINASSIVYGGTLNMTSGALTVTMTRVNVKKSRSSWQINTSGTYPVFQNTVGATYMVKSGVALMCEQYKGIVPTSGSDFRANDYDGCINITTANNVMVQDSRFSTVDDFYDSISDGLWVCTYLATPQTYQLTPQQVNTLLGQNNIWHDANGETEVEYYDGDINDLMPDVLTEGGALVNGEDVAYTLSNPVRYIIDPTSVTSLVGNNTIWTDGEDVTVNYISQIANNRPISGFSNQTLYKTKKNLLDNNQIVQGSINPTTGVDASSNVRVRSGAIMIKKGTYTIGVTSSAVITRVSYHLYDLNGNYLQGEAPSGWNSFPYTFTIAQDRIIKFVFAKPTNIDVTPEEVKGTVQLQVGSLTSSYEAYQGTTYPVTFPATNIWDEQWEVGLINPTTGQNETNSTTIRCKNYISVNPSTTYYFKSSANKLLFFYTADKTYISYVENSPGNVKFTTPNNAKFMRFRMVQAYGTTYNNDISINWTPFDHEYHSHSTPTTIYSGTLNRTTGELTVNMASCIFDGSSDESWFQYGYGGFGIDVPDIKQSPDPHYLPNIISNLFVRENYNDMSSNVRDNAVTVHYTIQRPIFYRAEITTVDDWKVFLSNNPVQLVYELSTAATYKLTPEEIHTIADSVNNMWCDTGNTTITAAPGISRYRPIICTAYQNDVPTWYEVNFLGNLTTADVSTQGGIVSALEAKGIPVNNGDLIKYNNLYLLRVNNTWQECNYARYILNTYNIRE